MSRFEWYLNRVVHFERPDTLTVDHDMERATTDLYSDRLCVNLRVADIFAVLILRIGI
jgi:hypothetical protein